MANHRWTPAVIAGSLLWSTLAPAEQSLEIPSRSKTAESSALDRLERRDATARWKNLRSGRDEAAAMAGSVKLTPVPSRELSEEASPFDQEDQREAASSTSRLRMPTNVRVPAPRRVAANPLDEAIRESPPPSPKDAPNTHSDRSPRSSEVPSEDSVQEKMAEAAAKRPRTPRIRSITEIQPFHDYVPDGGDPCEFLCPRPNAPRCPAQNAQRCPEESDLPLNKDIASFTPIEYHWLASNIKYNPLFFQDVGLERYGHIAGCGACSLYEPEPIQSVFSIVRFGVQLVGLPYQMALHPPCECISPLGYYRPGECAPALCYQVPLSLEAAAVEGVFYTGLAFLLFP